MEHLKNVREKLPINGFEPGYSGDGNNCYVNCAITSGFKVIKN